MGDRVTRGSLSRRGFLRLAGGVSAGVTGAHLFPRPAQSAAASTTVSFCLGADLATVQPHADSSTHSQNVIRHMLEPLVTRDDDLNYVPLLATSWRRINPTTMEFKLRENAKFHNGRPLTGEDVKFSIERILDPSLRLLVRSMIATIDHVDVVDSATVRVVTAKPDPILLNRIANQGAVIVPAETFKSQGAEAFSRKPIGTGPFTFVEWVKDDHLTMEANPTYWGGRPRIERLVYKPILEASTRLAALKTGAVDLIANVEPEQARDIQSDPNLRIARVRSARIMFVVLNTYRKPFDDVRVRQAMNYAVDVDAIVKDLMSGYAHRLPNIVGPACFGYDPGQQPYPYDPAKAKALLAQAGYPNGFEVPFHTPKGRYLLDAEIAQAVSGYLSKVGVRAKVEVMEWGNFLKRAFDAGNATNRLTMFFIGYGNNVLDIDDLLGGYFDSKRRGLYYNDLTLDALILKGQTTIEAEARLKIYREIQTSVREIAPWIFLFNPEDVFGINKRLAGWKARADEMVYLARASVE